MKCKEFSASGGLLMNLQAIFFMIQNTNVNSNTESIDRS